jgi:hypothetical protein
MLYEPLLGHPFCPRRKLRPSGILPTDASTHTLLLEECSDVPEEVASQHNAPGTAILESIDQCGDLKTARKFQREVLQQVKERIPHWRSSDFLHSFVVDPEQAVRNLRQNVAAEKVRPEQAAAILLPYLVKASYAQQNLIVGALEQIATPDQILLAALDLYKRADDPRLLSTANELLANRGIASWPALKRFCATNHPACRYFVATVATLEGISEEERRRALLSLARNPDVDTRRELLAYLDGGALIDTLPVWEVLATDPNQDIAALAVERTAYSFE